MELDSPPHCGACEGCRNGAVTEATPAQAQPNAPQDDDQPNRFVTYISDL
uniref:4Fe-4S ferredoxin-type domain-containing protein n=1 Tax=Mesocestoides corti TaxID=53468 RepID=A0A5K3EZT1_MESCO